MDQLAHQQFVDWPFVLARMPTRRPRHFSDNSICVDELTWHQNRSIESNLLELIWQCRDRFTFAYRLLRPRTRMPEILDDRSAIEFDSFYLGWSRICTTYRRLLFDAQVDMFANQRDRELQRWRGFPKEECFSRFTKDPEHVRCVLETARIMPEPAERCRITIDELIDDIIQDLEERYAFRTPTYA